MSKLQELYAELKNAKTQEEVDLVSFEIDQEEEALLSEEWGLDCCIAE